MSASARASGRYAVCTEGLCRAASLIVGKRKGFAHVYRNARDLGQGGAELLERDTGRVLVVEDNEFNMEVVRVRVRVRVRVNLG